MSATLEYLRPQTLDEALALLRRPDVRTVPLAGGTWLVPRLRRDVDVPDSLSEPVDAVVDLADLDLDSIELAGEPGNGWLTLGAATTLSQIAADPACQQIAGGILAQAARRAVPVNQRNAATVAGQMLDVGGQSELLLALLALAGQAVIAGAQPRTLPIAALLDDPAGHLGAGLVTAVMAPWPVAATGGLAVVARTPSDLPIVAAVAVVDGRERRLAVGGAAARPLVLTLAAGDDVDAALEAALQDGELLSDWQGSREYRREMAHVLSRRALAQAAG